MAVYKYGLASLDGLNPAGGVLYVCDSDADIPTAGLVVGNIVMVLQSGKQYSYGGTTLALQEDSANKTTAVLLSDLIRKYDNLVLILRSLGIPIPD